MARILIVEDEALIALMLEDFVRDAGMRCLTSRAAWPRRKR
jgi:DNA-binding response OmpR family regulator